jgi:hypothetical protein
LSSVTRHQARRPFGLAALRAEHPASTRPAFRPKAASATARRAPWRESQGRGGGRRRLRHR